MQIQVQLFATLATYLPKGAHGKGVDLEVPQGSTIQQVLEQLQVPLESVKLIFKNGVHAQKDSSLQENDRIGIFPPIGGG